MKRYYFTAKKGGTAISVFIWERSDCDIDPGKVVFTCEAADRIALRDALAQAMMRFGIERALPIAKEKAARIIGDAGVVQRAEHGPSKPKAGVRVSPPAPKDKET